MTEDISPRRVPAADEAPVPENRGETRAAHDPQTGADTVLTGYLAAEGFVEPLLAELGPQAQLVGERLVLLEGRPRPSAWAQNIWHEVERLPIASIKDGARLLKARQRNWALWPVAHFRRAKLIEDLLPPVAAKPLEFPAAAPRAPLGSWTLIEPDQILAARHCSSPFRHGEARFVEDRQAPPNRAYLKLWEALTLAEYFAGKRPQPGERCLDLGASPGGWSWVLQSLGARVTSVDKADLDPAIKALPGIEVRRESAFGLDPAATGPVDWLCSDVICYPERLLRLIERWMAAGNVRNFICTVKLQGEPDRDALAAFAAIPGSRLLHLFHNKNELTWMQLEKSAS